MDRVFELYVANDDLERSATLTLPASAYEIVDILEQLGPTDRGDLYFKIEERYKGESLADVLEDGITIRELNVLAWKLAEMDQEQEVILDGMIKMETPNSNDRLPYLKLLQLTENTDCCHLVQESRNDSQLGRFYAENGFVEGLEELPDKVFEMLDFEEIGREMRLAEDGVFTSGGYVVRHEKLREMENIPNLDLRKPLYTIQLEIRKAGERNGPRLNVELPLSREKLKEIQAKYPREEYEYSCLDCAVPFLKEHISGADAELQDINRLAWGMDFAQETGLLPKYKAVLQAVGCQDIELAAELSRSQSLGEYRFTPPETLSGPVAYAKKWLQEKLGKDADLVTIRDWGDMSYHLMKRHHVECTPYGLIQRTDGQPIQRLDQAQVLGFQMGGM